MNGTDAMSNWSLRALEDGRYALAGEFSFATAAPILERSQREFGSGTQGIEIDLAEVSHADSAGLAVLLEWLAWAKRQGRSLKFTHLPAQLLAVARISELEDLLTGGVSAA